MNSKDIQYYRTGDSPKKKKTNKTTIPDNQGKQVKSSKGYSKNVSALTTNDELSDDYYQAVTICLNTIARTISELETFTEKFEYGGRNGSTSFEDDFLKPLIRKHLLKLYEPVNEALKLFGLDSWSLYEVSAEENTDESGARTMEDITIIMRRPSGELFEEVVNIKATLGNTADNVGGWAAMGRALYGNSPDGKYIRQRVDFFTKVTSTPITDSLSDYFLWVFVKSPDPHDVLKSSRVSSFFGTNADAFYVNKNQPFPLQFKGKGACSLVGSGVTIIERKTNLLSKLHSEMASKLTKELDMHQTVLKKILEQQKGVNSNKTKVDISITDKSLMGDQSNEEVESDE